MFVSFASSSFQLETSKFSPTSTPLGSFVPRVSVVFVSIMQIHSRASRQPSTSILHTNPITTWSLYPRQGPRHEPADRHERTEYLRPTSPAPVSRLRFIAGSQCRLWPIITRSWAAHSRGDARLAAEHKQPPWCDIVSTVDAAAALSQVRGRPAPPEILSNMFV